jgi:hypothetical protein
MKGTNIDKGGEKKRKGWDVKIFLGIFVILGIT